SGGTVSGGPGLFTTNGTTSVSGFATLDGRTWNNAGTVNQSGASRVTLGSSAVVNNQGLWNLASSDANPLNNTGTFNNAGTLTKSGATAQTLSITAFNNSGRVNVAAGSLTLNAASATDTGDIDVAGTLVFGGARTLGAGSDVTGAGAVNFTGGTVTLNDGCSIAGTGTTTINGGTASFNTAGPTVSFANTLTLSSGTLTGTGNVTVNGPFSWSGGTVSGGPGLFTTNGTTSVSGFATLDGRTWNNAGTVNQSGASRVTLGSSAVVNNQGLWNLASSDANPLNNTGTFNNAGTLTKSGATAQTLSITAFNNSGRVNVAAGSLTLNAASATDTGDIDVAGTLVFGGARTLGAGSDVTGAGAVNFTGGTVTLN